MQPLLNEGGDLHVSNLNAKETGFSQISRGHWIIEMSRCCKVQSFCVSVKCDLSMTVLPKVYLSEKCFFPAVKLTKKC